MTAVLEPRHVHPQRWQEALGVSRETYACFFRDGRSPADAVRAVGLAASDGAGWAHAVSVLNRALCTSGSPPLGVGAHHGRTSSRSGALHSPIAPG